MQTRLAISFFMPTLPQSAAAKKTLKDISLVFMGLKQEATISVTPETTPVLEFLLGKAYEIQQKGGL